MCRPSAGGPAPGFLSASSAFLQGALFRLTCPGQHPWASPGPASWEGGGSGRNSPGGTQSPQTRPGVFGESAHLISEDKTGERTGFRQESTRVGYRTTTESPRPPYFSTVKLFLGCCGATPFLGLMASLFGGGEEACLLFAGKIVVNGGRVDLVSNRVIYPTNVLWVFLVVCT